MPHPKFLQEIADYYCDDARAASLPITTFIFPNKRSAMFLKHYIQRRHAGRFSLMPRFTTFTRFAKQISRSVDTSRFELLFILFKAYSAVLEERGRIESFTADFDKFVFWGDMILNDFDVIDSSLADAEKLYANLKNLKEISSDYLNDRQKEVIERLWGETKLTHHIEGFWFHIDNSSAGGDGKTEFVDKFIAIWEILGDVYRKFLEMLSAEGLSTPGLQMRRAFDIIRHTDLASLSKHRYVFVGHSDLSNAELGIMQRLKDAGCADFFWDIESPMFSDGERHDTTNNAVKFISAVARKFPMPDDFALSPVTSLPEIEIIGCPSSAAQTKIIGEKIAAMNLDDRAAFDTAIVVPDPSQLMSLMLSMPDNLPGLNITMGLPYSSTKFATLFSSVISMQRRARKNSSGQFTFFYQDVLEVLLHPHINLIAGESAALVRQYILDKRRFNIEVSLLMNYLADISFVFRPISDVADPEESHRYIASLIKGLKDSLSKFADRASSFEIKFLEYFEQQIDELARLTRKYSISMKETTFLSLFERILLSKNINMEGTPLKGLQVMGVLETRALDFDTVIIPAMNERSFPRAEYVRTMIPNNLRRGYGLPAIEHVESFYSYYFFRILSRASRAILLYDTRLPGKGRGEISRFLEQLLFIHNRGNVSHKIMELSGSTPLARTITIEKTPEVLERLRLFKQPGGLRLSASALKKFLKCPLEFYLEYVNNLRDDNDPTEYIDSASLGDIFHHAAQNIYLRYKNQRITATVIDEILSGDLIDREVLSEILLLQGLDPSRATFEDLNSEARLMFSMITHQLRVMFDAEKRAYCSDGGFEFVAAELDLHERQWTVGEHTFNFKMLIDRVDRVDSSTLRFIDYKTGKDGLEIKNDMETIFSGDFSTNGIFQLLTYAEAFAALSGDSADDIVLSLHVIKDIVRENEIRPITYRKEPLPPYSEIRDEFYPLLEKTINAIFDDVTPFTQSDDVAHCKYCPFISICGRTVPDDNF